RKEVMTTAVRRSRRGLLAIVGAAVTAMQIALAATAGACPCTEPQHNPNSPTGYWGQNVSDDFQRVNVRPKLPWNQVPGFPQDDPFYHPPARAFVDKKPGDLIAAREIVPAYFSVLPYDMDAWQLSYRSTDGHGNPIPAVTTVIKPKGGNGGRPRNLV